MSGRTGDRDSGLGYGRKFYRHANVKACYIGICCYDCGNRFGWMVSANYQTLRRHPRRRLSSPSQHHTSRWNTRPYARAWDRPCGHRTAGIGSVGHCLLVHSRCIRSVWHCLLVHSRCISSVGHCLLVHSRCIRSVWHCLYLSNAA